MVVGAQVCVDAEANDGGEVVWAGAVQLDPGLVHAARAGSWTWWRVDQWRLWVHVCWVGRWLLPRRGRAVVGIGGLWKQWANGCGKLLPAVACRRRPFQARWRVGCAAPSTVHHRPSSNQPTFTLLAMKHPPAEQVTATNVDIAHVAPKWHLYTPEEVEEVIARL